MTKFNLKSLLSLDFIACFLVFFLGILTFLQFETLVVFKYLLFFLFVALFIVFVVSQNIYYFLYPYIFLVLFDAFNLYYALGWPLWSIMLIIIVSLSVIGFFYLNKYSFDNKIQKYFLLSLLVLTMLEVFLSLISWPTDPRGKTIILLSVFYLLDGLIGLWAKKTFIFKKIFPYLGIGIIIISAIIITSPWSIY